MPSVTSPHLDEEIPRRIKKLFGIIEPLVMLTLISLVGTVALAIFLPLNEHDRRAGALSMKCAGRHDGFTLIKMIGVLAIISTLAAVLVPNVVKSVDEAVMKAEGEDLTALAAALESYTSSQKRIPNAAGWVAALAGVTSMSTNKVNLNERGFRRGYYVDPRFFTSTATAFAGYTQTSGRTAAPFSRIMIVSI